MTKTIVIDTSKCTACRSCQVACKQWNQLPAQETTFDGTLENPPQISPVTWMRVTFREEESAEGIEWYFGNQRCMHCTDAECERVCPTDAIKHSETGAVVIDQERCVGCYFCVDNCNFDVIGFNRRQNAAEKCTFCEDRVANGLQPACVGACPSGAIWYGDRHDMIRRAEGRADKLQAGGDVRARIYGLKELKGTNVLFVLRDDPENYGLPEEPELPTKTRAWNALRQVFMAPAAHLKPGNTVSRAMRDVILALIPVSIASIYVYHLYAVFLIVLCGATAILTEIAFRSAMGKDCRVRDFSAAVTGILIALCFAPTTPWWTAVIATILAVGVAKELMGGLGWNLFNPALFGYVAMTFLAQPLAFLNIDLAAYNIDLGYIDAVGQATPRALIQQGFPLPDYGELLVSFPAGALAETSPLLVTIGGLFLLLRRHINWRIPVSMIGTLLILALMAGQNPLYEVLTGGLLLGAFFMATDWVTSPITDPGKWIFGICIAVLVAIFRYGLGITEGVAFSILIMNAFVPFIERHTKRPTYRQWQELNEHGTR